MDFGLHLKNLRKRQGLTQARLAKILHVSDATIIRWENNYKLPSFECLLQMAMLFNVTLDYMAGIDKKRAIVTDRLSKSQESILRTLVVEFQSGHKDVGLTQRQQDILSALLIEFDDNT